MEPDRGIRVTNPGSVVETLTCLGCGASVDMARTDPRRAPWVEEHLRHEKDACPETSI